VPLGVPWTVEEEEMVKDDKVMDAMSAYIDGKMRRFGLLFSVNGGALAIAKLMADAETARLLGRLAIWHLALGAIIFTIMMVIDIWMFASMMRRRFLPGLAFSTPGKIILILLGVLIVTGWTLVAIG
jgi:hypothetical protein